ncbi:Zonular occludens toxin [Janthinobacterium sp. SUN026]|uniref:zonular occludens toxin domain-containing protein n=1 Tax=Janthinobacterium sp. SUN026 TaxID=3002438 RepID=UPI0025B11415|nr:zonular occludens toxin domain-containing protein [Janthinobacterium sp. SUN026]MDN2672861.1 Zonular occludens toxin [Janthinobacterium sp. SUN026]
MSINAYVGLQGSGKSYEFVSGPMLDAVMTGRRVITNVAGINEDRVHEYLVNSREANPAKLGSIVHVSNERIMEPYFFPDEDRPELETVVRGGDLVAVDEAWRFWGTDGGKLSHEHMQFFRMHRHYVHPDTAIACDVVLMTQDITGLHRSVKNVIEFAFRMQKHKSLGFTSRYRVEIYEGWKLNAKTRIDDRQKRYKTEIFPLYQSYTGGKGMEAAIDKRQNILGNKTLWFYAIGTVLCMTVGGWSAWNFFHRDSSSAKAPVTQQQAPGMMEQSTIGQVQSVAHTSPEAVFSDKWRYVGEFSSEGEYWVLVADPAGRVRVESPSAFHGMGLSVIGDIDGERVARWTGAVAIKNGVATQSSPTVRVLPEVSR